MTLVECYPGFWIDPTRVSCIYVDSLGEVRIVVDGQTYLPDISFDRLRDKLRPYVNMEAL